MLTGALCQLTLTKAYLLIACRQPLQGPDPAQVRVFSASAEELGWGVDCPDQRELPEAVPAEEKGIASASATKQPV